MISSGMGDFTYGFVSYALSGQYTWDGFLRFILATFWQQLFSHRSLFL